MFVEKTVPAGDFFVYVITLFSNDLESVFEGDAVKDVEEVLFFDEIDGKLLLTIDLGDDLFDAA